MSFNNASFHVILKRHALAQVVGDIAVRDKHSLSHSHVKRQHQGQWPALAVGSIAWQHQPW
jgi:hypothetical protein